MTNAAPIVRLLLAAEAAMNRPDYMAEAGLATKLTVRHARNRKTVRSERPAVTLIFVSAAPTQGDIGISMGEVQWKAVVDLQADIELATEDSARDPTALATLTRILATAVNALRNQAWEMAPLCDWVEMVEIDPEDRATPDDGRLVYAVNVVYRVLSSDENVLLAQGVTG